MAGTGWPWSTLLLPVSGGPHSAAPRRGGLWVAERSCEVPWPPSLLSPPRLQHRGLVSCSDSARGPVACILCREGSAVAPSDLGPNCIPYPQPPDVHFFGVRRLRVGCFCPPRALPRPEFTLSYTRGTWNAAQAGDSRLQGGGRQFLEKAGGRGEHGGLACLAQCCGWCWVTGPDSCPGAPGGRGGLAPPPALPRVSGFSARSRFPPQGSPFLRLAQLAFSMHYLFLSLISFTPPVLPPDRSGHPLQGSELICHSSFLLRALGKSGKVDEMLCPPSPP